MGFVSCCTWICTAGLTSVRSLSAGNTVHCIGPTSQTAFDLVRRLKAWQDTDFDSERNEMFMGVAQEFLRIVESGQTPSCTVQDGLSVMKVIDALRQSSQSGCAVALE